MKTPDNMGNPVVAMNYYNGGGHPKRKKKRLPPIVCGSCGQVIPDGYASCDCQTPAPASAAKCLHPAKKFCQLCGERFCPNEGCDPDHLEGCREANRP